MIGWLVILEQLVAWELAEEAEVLGENLPQFPSLHLRSQMTWPGIKLCVRLIYLWFSGQRTRAFGSNRLHWSYNKIYWDTVGSEVLTAPVMKSTVLWDITPAFTLAFCSPYSTLKMEALCSSRMSVDFQLTTRRHISEESTLHIKTLPI
jgi:hypothetical protein